MLCPGVGCHHARQSHEHQGNSSSNTVSFGWREDRQPVAWFRRPGVMDRLALIARHAPIRPPNASGRRTGRESWGETALWLPWALWTRLAGFWLVLAHRVVAPETTQSARSRLHFALEFIEKAPIRVLGDQRLRI